MHYRTILLVGAPGAGKGTQGKILGTVPDFYHCSCGEVFRNLTIDSELGRIFVKHSSKGKLVERLQRRALRDNRLDDARLEVIKKRLAVYEKETRPVLDYYGPELVHTIDSTQTPINVLRDVLRVISRI